MLNYCIRLQQGLPMVLLVIQVKPDPLGSVYHLCFMVAGPCTHTLLMSNLDDDSDVDEPLLLCLNCELVMMVIVIMVFQVLLMVIRVQWCW